MQKRNAWLHQALLPLLSLFAILGMMITGPKLSENNESASEDTGIRVSAYNEKATEEVGLGRHLNRVETTDNMKWWETSPTMPQWLKNFTRWQNEQRWLLNETNWDSFRYLMIRCLESDGGPCGGASDRLQPVPYGLLYARLSNRMFFIRWTKPAPLENFLVPPPGGLNWSMPEWLADKLDLPSTPVREINKPDTLKRSMRKALVECQSTSRVISMRIRTPTHSRFFYKEKRDSPDEPEFDAAFGETWRLLFTPSPPVAALIDKNMNTLGLQKGAYVAAHARLKHGRPTAKLMDQFVRDSINCAAETRPGLPIYFASDNSTATVRAVEYGRQHGVNVVTRKSDNEPLHLDRGRSYFRNNNNWKNIPPSDFYETFVDFYLLGSSDCVMYGMGAYGLWASLVSRNLSCAVSYYDNPYNGANSQKDCAPLKPVATLEKA